MGDHSGLIDPQTAVDQLFGEGRAQVVESVTSTRITETEVILINGTPVQLVGKDGESLKEALLAGRLPDQGLLNRILVSVLGNEVRGVTKVESEVNVTSKMKTKDTLSVLKDGRVVDERTKEWQSDSESVGRCSETFRPSLNSFSTSSSPIFTSSSASDTSSGMSSTSSRTSPSPVPGIPVNTSNNFGSNHSAASSDFGPTLSPPFNPSSHFCSRQSSSVNSSSLAEGGNPILKQNNGFSLPLKPIDSLPLAKETPRKVGVCMSPELEESLARTSIKDKNGYKSNGYMDHQTRKDNGYRNHNSYKPSIGCHSGLNGHDGYSRQNGDYVSLHKPTIFGTVADDLTPRDNTKRGFPQTPSNGKPCSLTNIEVPNPPSEWALNADDDNSLVYEDGVLVSGSLQALIQHATPTSVYYPDTAYLFAFLLSSRLFVKPHDLLQRICDLGFSQQGFKGSDLATINKDQLGNFIPHMVQLLGDWSENFPYDFRDERMMVGVRTLTHRCIALQPALRRDVTQVLHNLLNKLTQLERYEESLSKHTVPPPANVLELVPDITEVCQSALLMAQQLTHIELERLSYIGPEEFVQAFAKDNLEATYKDLKKTNNLESYVQWFNRLSFHVATQACSPVKKKQRVRVIEYWIEVARECFNIGNFNSLMGIIAGLNMSPISRLKKTWNKVQSAKFSVLEHQMDPTSNFSSYRSTLKAAMWRSAGAVDERQKIVIPFFSLLVKDLYFLNEGCANRLPNGHINFDKFWQLAKQVTEFMAWKQVSCPFEKAPEVLHFLQTTPVLSETGLALASFEGEGPENSYEKERSKSLKLDQQRQSSS